MNQVLLPALISFFMLFSAISAWAVVPGYSSYANISINSWNGKFDFNSSSLGLGNEEYAYINTSFNSTLASTPMRYLTISAYSYVNGAAGNAAQFVGNVTAFPYPDGNGMLVSSATTNGRAYDFITIFFNQLTPENTYLGQYLSGHILTSTEPFLPQSTELIVYNTSGISKIPLSTIEKHPGTADLSGTLVSYFDLTEPYLLVAQSSQSSNLTLNYGFSQYRTLLYSYTVDGANDTMWADTPSGGIDLSAHDSRPVYLYLDPDGEDYLFLSREAGIGSNEGYNVTAFNATKRLGYDNLAFMHNSLHDYQLSLSYGNLTRSDPLVKVYLIPAYTTNYTVTGVVRVTNPVQASQKSSESRTDPVKTIIEFLKRIRSVLKKR